MKKLFIEVLILISFCCALCLSACYGCGTGYYQTVTDDILIYSGYVNEDAESPAGSFTVTGYLGYPTEIVIPETFNGNNVTGISGDAFLNCKSLKSITISAGITRIPDGVFGGCENLVSINIAEENPVYRSEGECVIERQTNTVIAACNASTIPDGVSVIGRSAFANCNRIKAIAIPETVTEIDDGAFEGCGALERFTVNKKNNNYSDLDGILYNKKKTDILSVPVAINGEITFPDSLTEIEEAAFKNRIKLRGAVIGQTVEKIGEGAFSGCSGLESITLPFVGCGVKISSQKSSLFGYIFGKDEYEGSAPAERYPDYSYWGAAGEKFYLPKSLKSVTVTGGKINECAFSDCTYIEYVTLESGVDEVQAFAFYKCSSLKSVSLDAEILGTGAFGECKNLDAVALPAKAFDALGKETRASLKTVEITRGDELVSNAFRDCGNVEHISLPSTIKKVGQDALTGLTACEFIEFGDGYYAGGADNPYMILVKAKNDKITKFTAHPDALFIHSSAFAYCKELVDCNVGNSVISIGDLAFRECRKLINLTLSDCIAEVESTAFTNFNNNCNFNKYGNCNYFGSVNNPYVLLYKANENLPCTVHKDTKIIYSEAFSYYKYDTVEIPYGVKTISDRAFYSSCIKDVDIPESVVYIGNSAFWYCDNLTGITVPAGVAFIGKSAFGNCGGLTGIAVDVGNRNYYGKGNCLIEKESKKLIAGCKNSVIPKGVVSIGDKAFIGCVGLKSATIPDGVVSVGDNSFDGCVSLVSIFIPDSVQTIGERAFRNCESLKRLNIPKSVISLGRFLCEGCSNLVEICVAAGNEEFYSQDNCIIDKNSKTLILGCKNSIIPDGTVAIGESAFNGCKELTDINIPESVTYLGWYAFHGCTGLTVITVPGNIYRIGGYAFCECTGLTEVIFSDGVSYIGERAFDGCKNLTKVTLPDSLKSIGYDAFFNSGLTDINYKGTKEEWNTVTVKGWDDGLREYTVHCIDGDIVKTEKK